MAQNGIDLIARERKEQKTKHNSTIEMDVEFNNKGQLRQAAAALLLNDINAFPLDWLNNAKGYELCLKMIRKDERQRAIIAGALCAAEVDRLNAIEKK